MTGACWSMRYLLVLRRRRAHVLLRMVLSKLEPEDRLSVAGAPGQQVSAQHIAAAIQSTHHHVLTCTDMQRILQTLPCHNASDLRDN